MANHDKILHCAFFTPISRNRWGLPLLLWGPPGVGKTAVINSLGKRFGLPVEVLSPGERGEGAFGVVPVPTAGPVSRSKAKEASEEDSLRLSYPAPDWTDKVNRGGIVFVDEMTCAPPALQPPLLGLIQERRIGSHTLGPRVRVLGAANPPEQAAGGWDLAPPVANRLGHITWGAPEVDAWSDWLLGGGGDEEVEAIDSLKEEARVSAHWEVAFARAKGLASAFLKRRPELLMKQPQSGDPNASKAWPSPRSWENAVRSMAAGEVHELNGEDFDDLVGAFVGTGVASELAEFRAQTDLPDPEDVLEERTPFKHDPKRLDRTFAVLQSCAALISPTTAKRRLERGAVYWKLLGACMKGGEDLVVPAIRIMTKAELVMPLKEVANPVLEKILPMLRECGIRPEVKR